MEQTARIDVNTFKTIAEGLYSPTKDIIWNGLEITINKTLSLTDMMKFVDNVTKMCFSEDNGAYLPEIKDFAIKSCILEMYANFSLPDNASERYDLIYSTDVVDTVIDNINRRQFQEVIDAIEDKTANIAQANIEMVNKQMNELYIAFDNLQTQLFGLFDGIEPNDMKNLVGAMSGGTIDEEKFIKAYMEQNKPQEENGKVIPITKGSDK